MQGSWPDELRVWLEWFYSVLSFFLTLFSSFSLLVCPVLSSLFLFLRFFPNTNIDHFLSLSFSLILSLPLHSNSLLRATRARWKRPNKKYCELLHVLLLRFALCNPIWSEFGLLCISLLLVYHFHVFVYVSDCKMHDTKARRREGTVQIPSFAWTLSVLVTAESG
jgi:hypothetical protein